MKNLGVSLAAVLCLFLATSVVAPVAVLAGGGGSCEGDVNEDGQVDFFDLIEILHNWGECGDPCPADVNGDGFVDFHDMLVVLQNFGPCDGMGCTDSSECDDGDDCTWDICILGACMHFEIPHCP
jgi:hypothetical protein